MQTIILMGVSGSGKTTIGKRLAEKLQLPFYDGDDFHPESNRHKMQILKQPLTDADREPWLRLLAEKIRAWNQTTGAVLACSALKQSYRALLAEGGAKIRWVYLHGPQELLQARLAQRHGHFFPPSLLESQLQTIEPPSNAIVISIDQTPAMQVEQILAKLTTEDPGTMG